MRRTSILIVLFIISMVFVNCEDKTHTPKTIKKETLFDKYPSIDLKGKPNKSWVGKHLIITFNNKGGRALAGKTKLVHLLSYDKDNDGYKYFSVKDISNGYLEEVYFFWFSNVKREPNFSGPTIITWKEALLK